MPGNQWRTHVIRESKKWLQGLQRGSILKAGMYIYCAVICGWRVRIHPWREPQWKPPPRDMGKSTARVFDLPNYICRISALTWACTEHCQAKYKLIHVSCDYAAVIVDFVGLRIDLVFLKETRVSAEWYEIYRMFENFALEYSRNVLEDSKLNYTL